MSESDYKYWKKCYTGKYLKINHPKINKYCKTLTILIAETESQNQKKGLESKHLTSKIFNS